MSENNTFGATPSNALIQALVRLLRPLVRLLIRQQISYPFLSELLKSIYLEVAAEAAKDEPKRITDSRLSLMTGVHRKDVRRLRQENETIVMPELRPASLGAQVIAAWLSEYVDEAGHAVPLYRLATHGHPSFEAMVDELSHHDVRARALLDDWVKNGIASIDAAGKVVLEKQAFIPQDNFDEKVFFMGHHLHDHMSACVENLLQQRPVFFERGVYYNNLSTASVQELKMYVDYEAMALIKNINQKARLLQKEDMGDALAVHRFRYGAYFYSDQYEMIKGKQNEQQK